MKRTIIFYGAHFLTFYQKQSEKVQDKIDYVFRIVSTIEHVPERFLKHIEGSNGLFEIRVDFGSNTFRIFCCFDSGALVVLFNAFQKKSQKTPREELQLAKKLMTEYFSRKK